jgi:hypothetical protein
MGRLGVLDLEQPTHERHVGDYNVLIVQLSFEHCRRPVVSAPESHPPRLSICTYSAAQFSSQIHCLFFVIYLFTF